MSELTPEERRRIYWENRSPKKKKKSKKGLIAILIIIILLAVAYLTFVYSENHFIRKWRNIYIETAMSTTHHKWLATFFIPGSIIDEVMAEVEAALEAQKDLESSWDIVEEEESEAEDAVENFFAKYWEIDSESVRNYLEMHYIDTEQELNELLISDLAATNNLLTVEGDKLLVCDASNGLLIIEVKGTDYVGKLAIEKDPSLVELDKSQYLGSKGEIIDDYGERNDAVLAVNASGFKDVGGHGSGGEVKGSLVINGTEYGSPNRSDYKFIGMKYNNKFYISNWTSVDISEYRWGVQFFPAIVVDGECVVAGTYGLGIQPRTAIGQAKDGSFMMLVVDGRQVGYSLGCTMEECANQMIKYGVYQAANLDGGSSSIMWYDGQQITKSSSPSGYGRYLPDAILVKKSENS